MIQIFNDLKDGLRLLNHHPDYNRLHAEIRYLLMKGAAKHQHDEEKRLGKAYRKKRALNEYCAENGISFQTLYRYRRIYRRGGIEALVPKFGNRSAGTKKNKESDFGRTIKMEVDINLNAPLRCLKNIQEIIEKEPSIAPEAKESANLFLEHCLKYASAKPWIYKRVILKRELNHNVIEKLGKFIKSTHRNHRDKAIAIIMASRGSSLLEISFSVRRSATTVRRWINKFEKEGVSFIKTTLDQRKNNLELKERTNRIVKILHRSPKDYNINRATWHIEAIAAAYKNDYGKSLSTSAVHRAIKETNYSWRRAKKVLTSPDPKYRQKSKKFLMFCTI